MVLSDYERQQIEEIAAWKGEAPGRVSRALARVRRPLGRIGASLVPDAALRKALDSLDAALDADGQVAKFLGESGVATVDDLKRGPLEECDRLAEHCGVRAQAVAGAVSAPDIASRMRPARERMLSLRLRFARWVSTVLTERTRTSAISRLVRPSPIR